MGGGSKKRLEGESKLLIGLHGNQRSMCKNLSLLVSCSLFFSVPFLFLVLLCFCWVSYLAYTNLLGKKAFDVVVADTGILALQDLGVNCVELMPCHEFNELEYSTSSSKYV
jgi:hypothetical protein